MIAFSATSSVSHERVLAHCLAKPKVVCFKSEYELLHGINPTAEAAVVVCADADKFKL